MQYLGGKSRTYSSICTFLESVRKPNQTFVEPFCGACWVTQGMSGNRHASDANQALVNLHKAIQQGWQPPTDVTQDTYSLYAREQNPDDPMTAFLGFGCSFAGKWFGGFARSNDRNYASNAKNSLMKKAPRLACVKFSHRQYQRVDVSGALIYCDPPYDNTTGYGAVGEFDSGGFWATMRDWAARNTVVVSEYAAPADFVCVLEIGTKTDMHTKSGKAKRIEKLFMHESQAPHNLRVVPDLFRDATKGLK